MTLTFIHVLKTGFSVSMLVATIMKEWKLKLLKKTSIGGDLTYTYASCDPKS